MRWLGETWRGEDGGFPGRRRLLTSLLIGGDDLADV